MERTFLDNVKIFGLLYVISIGIMYYLSKRAKQPMIIPGDIYKTKGGRITYFPSGGALLVAIALYLIINIIAKKFGA